MSLSLPVVEFAGTTERVTGDQITELIVRWENYLNDDSRHWAPLLELVLLGDPELQIPQLRDLSAKTLKASRSSLALR
jgi:hypothetical protein